MTCDAILIEALNSVSTELVMRSVTNRMIQNGMIPHSTKIRGSSALSWPSTSSRRRPITIVYPIRPSVKLIVSDTRFKINLTSKSVKVRSWLEISNLFSGWPAAM